MTNSTGNKINFEIFRNYADEQIKLNNNVGIAISIFTKNKTLFQEGLGYKNYSKKLPFTSNTLFPIGSHTKSITATGIALLIDEGCFDWETPIREYLPEFKMKDSFASERTTIKDVLSHTTGLPHHQFTYMNYDWNYKDVLKRLPYLESVFDFRSKHKYSNLNYFIATKVIEEVSGENYHSFITERIFKPLGMNNTNFSITDSFKTNDYTLGYNYSENKFSEEEYLDLRNVSAGCGSINSCLEDMTKWIKFHLNNGKVNLKQIISEETLNNLYVLQRLDKNPLAIFFPEKHYISTYGYGLGWWVLDYRGTIMIQHYGNGPGINFNGGFLPNMDLGYIIFSNTTGSDLPYYLNFHIIDQILGLDIVDWGNKLREYDEMIKKELETRKQQTENQNIKEMKPSHDLKDFIGKYLHPGYGILDFYLENNKLIVNYGETGSRLIEVNHYNYNTFKIEIMGPFGVSKYVNFIPNFHGEITKLEIDAEPMLKPAIFVKQ